MSQMLVAVLQVARGPACEAPKVHMVILWHWFTDVLLNTCVSFSHCFSQQGLLFLQLGGDCRQAAPTQAQRQQDPHRGLGEDHHWPPQGHEQTTEHALLSIGCWSSVGPTEAPSVHHFVHLNAVFAKLHLGSELSRMLTVNKVICSHIRSHSHLISAHHMQEWDSGTSCRHPAGCFFLSSVHLNYTSWFAEFMCLIDLLIILTTCEHSNPVLPSLSRIFTMVTALRKPSTATPVFCTSLSIDTMMATSSLAVATPAR